MEQARRILEDKGILPHMLVRVEQTNPGQEEDWEFFGVVMQDNNPVAEVRKGNDIKYIPAGRLAAWQKHLPKPPKDTTDNSSAYRDRGSMREFEAVNKELKEGLENTDR